MWHVFKAKHQMEELLYFKEKYTVADTRPS